VESQRSLLSLLTRIDLEQPSFLEHGSMKIKFCPTILIFDGVKDMAPGGLLVPFMEPDLASDEKEEVSEKSGATSIEAPNPTVMEHGGLISTSRDRATWLKTIALRGAISLGDFAELLRGKGVNLLCTSPPECLAVLRRSTTQGLRR